MYIYIYICYTRESVRCNAPEFPAGLIPIYTYIKKIHENN